MGQTDVRPSSQRPAEAGSWELPRRVRRGIDVGVVILLTVLAYLVRRDGLPTDGLWFDDSWVAAGAIHGKLTALMTTGSGHPAFTALLMAWHQLGGGSLRSLAYPALIAGVAGPPLLYLALRSFGYEQAISALMGATLVVGEVHILYSGRVKGYTLDTVLVLALAIALPHLAKVRWRWPLAAAWVVAAVVVGSFSGYVLVASAVAGLLLVLHARSDRLVRLVAVGAQGAVQLLYLRAAQHSTDLAGIEDVMEEAYDGHMTFFWNPVRFAGESLKHLRRVAAVFPGGSGTWLSIAALLALAGLVIAAFRGRRPAERLPAQFFLLLLVVAFVGALAGRFPFGPTVDNLVSSGGRHTLWMLPCFAFGLAAILHRVRAAVPKQRSWRLGFDAVVVAVAAVVLIQGYGPALGYPFPGSDSAVRFVQSEVGPNDAVIITTTDVYKYMISSDVPLTLRATPDRQIGFTPAFEDPRLHTIGEFGEVPGTPAEIRAMTDGADRVFLITGGAFGGGLLNSLGKILTEQGYRMDQHDFGAEVVQVWSR